MKAHYDEALSALTAVLPQIYADQVISALTEVHGSSVLIMHARGTLLQDKWYRRMLPTISPAKVMLQLWIPSSQLDAALAIVIEHGKLHLQGSGAVFASHCDHFWAGSAFHDWPVDALTDSSIENHPGLLELKKNLSVIYAVVERDQTSVLSKVAINAGAHGPIVFLGEGHGLRDKLGWLRITKQVDKEVMMLVVEERNAKDIFSAIANAAEMHLPGRGFMFMIPQKYGMFNLPSLVSTHAYDASMQQIISAIDSLNGHTHWRDQSAYTKGVKKTAAAKRRFVGTFRADQCMVCAVVERGSTQQLTDMMLAAGATGMQISYARFAANEEGCELGGAKINKEYAIFRAVRDPAQAKQISDRVRRDAEQADLADICMYLQPIPLVASYVPGAHNYRSAPLLNPVEIPSEDAAHLAARSKA